MAAHKIFYKKVLKYETNRIFDYEVIRNTTLNLKIMKASSSIGNITAVIILCIFTGFITMGFRDSTFKQPTKNISIDTVPATNHIDIHIDLNDVNKAMDEVNKELKKIEWDKISADVKSSLRDVEISLNNINWDKMQRDIDKSIHDIDLGNIDIQINKNLNEKEMKMTRKELQKVREVQLKEARKQLEKAKEQLRQSKKELEKSKFYRDKSSDEVMHISPAPEAQKILGKNKSVASSFPFLEKLGFFHFV